MTEVLLFTLAMLVLTGPTNTFDIQAELQGNYDEISQATLQFVTPSDVDMFHDVLYTPDWCSLIPRATRRPGRKRASGRFKRCRRRFRIR